MKRTRYTHAALLDSAVWERTALQIQSGGTTSAANEAKRILVHLFVSYSLETIQHLDRFKILFHSDALANQEQNRLLPSIHSPARKMATERQ